MASANSRSAWCFYGRRKKQDEGRRENELYKGVKRDYHTEQLLGGIYQP